MCESCFYGTDVLYSNDSLDLLDVSHVERSYELIHCQKCHNCFFSSDLSECTNIYFSHNLTDCHDCIGCVGLRHKQYCIFNKQYGREEYLREKEKFDFGSRRACSELEEHVETLRIRFPVKFMHGFSNVNSTGDYMQNCKELRQ